MYLNIISCSGLWCLSFTLLMLSVISSTAQSVIHDFALKAAVENASPHQMVHLAAGGDIEKIVQAIHEHGGIVQHKIKDRIVFRIPAKAVAKISSHSGVDYIEFNSGKGVPLNDSMLVNNRVVAVHEGIAGPATALSGKDVIVGLVDTGIELLHPDFQHEDGTTRIKFLWDQNQEGAAPESYGYGAEWTSAEINSGVTGHQDQPQYFGHGSTVTGTAAGNGFATGEYKGVAPEADLIIVSSAFGAPNWTLTVADAVQYIFEKADELGKPAVVNLSLGTYSGSHDGLDAAALVIDSLINAQPGRAVVCAAGNSGNWPAYHLDYDVTSDTSFTWFQYNANSALGYGAVFFELWADTADFNEVQFAMGADRVIPSLDFRGATPYYSVQEVLNQVVSDSIIADGNLIAVADYSASLRGAQYKLQVHIAQPDSSQYRFRFMTTGAGRFDIWSSTLLGTSNMLAAGLPTPETFPDMATYRFPDKQKHMVSSWAASPHVITVGNYNNRSQYVDYNGNLQTFDPPAGELSINSSFGPTRDNRLKPELSASGDLTLSSGKFSVLAAMINNEPHKVAPGGMHYRNGGTSMASPVVAGAAALLLEQCPQADMETIRTAILDNVYQDGFTGDAPDVGYGYGKLDAEAAVQSLFYIPEFSHATEIHLCSGEITELQLADSYAQYQWSTGSESATVEVGEAGYYSVEVMDETGCRGRSDTVSVLVHDISEVMISLVGDTLLAVEDTLLVYQWLLDDAPIEGATNHFWVPDVDGTYALQVTNASGCSVVSNEIEVITTTISKEIAQGETKIYPVPAREVVYIESEVPVHAVKVWSTDGKVWLNDHQPRLEKGKIILKTGGWPAGIYILRVETDHGVRAVKLILS